MKAAANSPISSPELMLMLPSNLDSPILMAASLKISIGLVMILASLAEINTETIKVERNTRTAVYMPLIRSSFKLSSSAWIMIAPTTSLSMMIFS
ncbi:MAG: hypothetical protein H7833_01840 [Magnetococcus sp. DMHC-1]